MQTAEFLKHLRQLNVRLSVENGQLISTGPKGAVTEELRVELTARKEELVRLLEGETTASSGLTIPRISREKDLPLSFAQRRLWFLDQLEPGSRVYNVPGVLRINGPLVVETLQRSLNEIVARHEALRTTFSMVENEPVQIIAASLEVSLPVIDLSQVDETEREQGATRLASEEAGKPFDLCVGPLIRAALIRLREDDHILVLTQHHIVSDGWSMTVLHRELSVLYRAFSNGQPSPLAELPIQYADFAAWQQNWLRGEVLESQLSYWEKQLDGVPAVLNLPTDRPRPARKSYKGERQLFGLSAELTQQIKALSRKEGVTLYMTLLAAFQVMLHRYTGQNDIVVGSPIANRNRVEIEELIGFFVNTLVLRTNFSGNPAFRELLQRVRKTALEAYEHQDLPFEKLVEELKPERSLSYSPLFQVMFVLQSNSKGGLRIEGLRITPMQVAGETTKFDLTLFIRDDDARLSCVFSYNPDLFESETIRRMVRHYETLLHGIVANAGLRVGSLPLLTTTEREQLLDDWNKKPAREDLDSGSLVLSGKNQTSLQNHPLSVEQTIAAWASQTPDAVALAAPGREPLTYALLSAQFASARRDFEALGIGCEDRVALVLSNGPEMAVALLALMTLGICAPLNPSYRAEEFDFYLKDLEATALVIDAGIDSPARNVARRLGIPIIELSPVQEAQAGVFTLSGASGEPANAQTRALPSDVALLLHTSGTTSRPKLAPLTHSNLAISARNVKSALALTVNDRCLNVMPLYHIHGLVGALFSSLAAGGSVVCTPGFYAPEFLKWLSEFRPTWYTAVPAMHQAILARAKSSAVSLSDSSLRFIRSSSAPLPRRIMEELEKVFHAPVIEAYGMTEAAHQMASNPRPPGQRKPGSVGFAAGPEVAIMDEFGSLLSAGSSGEVVIRGANVISGYGGDARVGGEYFTRGWFRTGDRGYLDNDGYLFLTGRYKELINRGGEKISPREVDDVLMDHPSVSQAAAFPIPHRELGEEVVAAVVLRNGTRATAAELREFAATRLADFKVPRQIVFVEQIPHGPTGKIQREGLAEKLGLAVSSDKPLDGEALPFEPPQTALEVQLADIWSQVLKIDRVGRRDDFFHLGGDSILATQVLSRINGLTQLTVTLATFFETPTLAGLAEVIEHKTNQVSEGRSREILEPSAVPFGRTARSKDLIISPSQQALWFLAQLDPDSPAHNRPEALRLNGNLNVTALERSLIEVVHRHEALRTTFSSVDGVPVPIIGAAAVSMPIVDLSTVPPAAREERVKELAREEYRRPFNLAEDPMLRTALLKIAPTEYILLVTMHHIASDGWSSEIFFRDLALYYNAFSTGRQPELPPLAVQYVDFAAWQQQLLQGERLDRLLSYWTQQIGDSLPHLRFSKSPSTLHPGATREGERQFLHLPSSLNQALKAVSAEHQVTLFMTLLAAFMTAFRPYSEQDELLVGVPIAGRIRRELEGVIGSFSNILAIKSSLSGNLRFSDLLVRVRKAATQAYAHQELPLATLAEVLRRKRGSAFTLGFQVIFNQRNYPDQSVEFATLRTDRINIDDGIARFDLSVDVTESSDTLCCSFAYDRASFDPPDMMELMQRFQTSLERAARNPHALLDDLIRRDPVEHRTAPGWKKPTRGTQKARGSHHFFEDQAAATPNAIAVSCDGNGLSYAALNRRANKLARYLRRLGIGPDHLVGICVERSLEMAIGILGILKAGAAYVPLSPEYPKERLAFLLRDMSARAVVSQRRLVSALPAYGAPLICLDSDWPVIAEEEEDNLEIDVFPHQLAYVIYTSGTTGKPKGVLVTHHGVCKYAHAIARYFALRGSDRVSQCASLGFDIAVEELFPSWISGATVVLCPSGMFYPNLDFTRWLKDEQITVLNLPTAFWHGWVYELERFPISVPGSLRLVIVGGEKASSQALRTWKRFAAHLRWVNTYGPTEATVTTTVYEASMTDVSNHEPREIPIGKPIDSAEVYVLDRYLQPVPVGVSGELYIGGHGLARGYLNRADLTAEQFVPHPFSAEPGAVLYKTGDSVRYCPDGNLEFVGRMDQQVKLRGFRIEPREIEAALAQHPAVGDTVVLAREVTPGQRYLVAYLVGRNGSSPISSELRKFLKEKLPEYMVPSDFVVLKSFPLSAHGKVDIQALPEPDRVTSAARGTYVAPRTETEKAMAEIWREVLRIDKIGIHDNFFDLGGHSLLAVKLFARLDQAFGRLLPLSVLFEAPTVHSLAARYQAAETIRQDSILTRLCEGGSLPPIYAVPGVFGNVVGFADLSRELGPEQPFYGLQSVGLDGTELPLESIEAIAQLYVAEMRKTQAREPYVLIGACFGATVAYEMARQLLEAGEEVAFLGLLDPTRREGGESRESHGAPPRILKRLGAIISLLRARVELYRDEMRRLDAAGRCVYIARKLRLFCGSLGRGFKGVHREFHQLEVYRANVIALDRYLRKPLKGRLGVLEIFETSRATARRGRDKFDWSKLWEGKTVRHLLPGKDSGDMVSGQNARVLAVLLAEQIRKAIESPLCQHEKSAAAAHQVSEAGPAG